jgi:hypothetical protein
MRRTTNTVLSAILGLALAAGLAGHATTGAAAPAGSSASTATGQATSTAGTTTVVSVANVKKAKKRVLGPKGVGALKLGMTRKQAEKTKLVKKRKSSGQGGRCDTNYKLTGTKRTAVVFYSKKLGIASITAYPGLATPQGIKLGSSAKAVKKAYPDWRSLTDEGLTGRGLAKVPGNKKARYNISISRGKVTHLQLQLRNQNCYE